MEVLKERLTLALRMRMSPSVDRGDEVDVVHGDGDGYAAGVAGGGEGGDKVDELEEAAAEEVAEGVGVAGEDDLGALGLGGGYRARGRAFRHRNIVRGEALLLWLAATGILSGWIRLQC